MSLDEQKTCMNESYSHSEYCPDENCDNFYSGDELKKSIKELRERIIAKQGASDYILKGNETIGWIEEIFGKELNDVSHAVGETGGKE